jgi:hypothetical protein
VAISANGARDNLGRAELAPYLEAPFPPPGSENYTNEGRAGQSYRAINLNASFIRPQLPILPSFPPSPMFLHCSCFCRRRRRRRRRRCFFTSSRLVTRHAKVRTSKVHE